MENIVLDKGRLQKAFAARQKALSEAAWVAQKRYEENIQEILPFFENTLLPRFYRRIEEEIASGKVHFVAMLEPRDIDVVECGKEHMDTLWRYSYDWLKQQGLTTDKDIKACHHTLRVSIEALEKLCK
jgi:hypothetical protein